MIPNDGAAPHNFSIDELGIDVDLAPGETQETVINAPAGEYEYYCNVPGHKEAGMVGTLIVTEDAAAAAPARERHGGACRDPCGHHRRKPLPLPVARSKPPARSE